MTSPILAGASPLLAATLLDGPIAARLLLNAEPAPDPEVVVARCCEFALSLPSGTEALIVTLLQTPAPGLQHFPAHAAIAALWAFTREAALEWAPRGLRINAIGLGTSPSEPFQPQAQAGRPGNASPASPATNADIARTIRAMACLPSMTGQIIRLGA